MGEGPVTIIPSGRNFGDKSVDELEAILDSLTPDGQIPEPTPEPEPEPPKEEAHAPVEAAPPEPEPEPEPEVDAKALETEGERIKREKLEAQLALQQAHSSRLAGEIGHLREQLKTISQRPSEPYQPETQAEMDRLAQLEQRLQQSEAQAQKERVTQAVMQAASRLEAPELKGLAAELETLVPKYKDQFAEVVQFTDPVLARQTTEAIVRSMEAEAREANWANRHKVFEEKKAATVAENQKAKKSATISASGAVPAAPPKPKTYADMTPAELDAWLRENVR